MRIFLDDERKCPEGFIQVRTYDECVAVLDVATFISFDHDLGEEKTGYDVAKLIESRAHNGTIQQIGWAIHSANPIGRKNIEMAMCSAERAWGGFLG